MVLIRFPLVIAFRPPLLLPSLFLLLLQNTIELEF